MENKTYSIVWDYKGEIQGRQIRVAPSVEEAATGFREEMRSILLQHTQGQEVDLYFLKLRIEQMFDSLSRTAIIWALRSASNDELVGILKEVLQ